MNWRLILVVSIITLLIGIAVHFSDPLMGLVQKAWSLDKDELEKLKEWREILADVFGALGALGTGAWAVWKFIVGDKKKDSEKSTVTNSTVFNEKVEVHGDFVQGNKNTTGGDDG